MQIIEISRFSEIEGKCHGYCAEPNPEAAIAEFVAHYGYQPHMVYYKRTASGRCTVYCQLEEDGGN